MGYLENMLQFVKRGFKKETDSEQILNYMKDSGYAGMSPEEKWEQRINFVKGNLGLASAYIDDSTIRRIAMKLYSPPANPDKNK